VSPLPWLSLAQSTQAGTANQQLSRQNYLLGDFLGYKENISRIFTADAIASFLRTVL
jgi:hypothetical protein